VHPTLFPVCLYCSYCLLLSFSFFPGWRSVCPGGYAALAWVVCGSTAVPLSSPCLRLPKPSGCGWLVAQGPSWFLRLMWSGDALHWLEVWRGLSFGGHGFHCGGEGRSHGYRSLVWWALATPVPNPPDIFLTQCGPQVKKVLAINQTVGVYFLISKYIRHFSYVTFW
jgi:hypothetical protein